MQLFVTFLSDGCFSGPNEQVRKGVLLALGPAVGTRVQNSDGVIERFGKGVVTCVPVGSFSRVRGSVAKIVLPLCLQFGNTIVVEKFLSLPTVFRLTLTVRTQLARHRIFNIQLGAVLKKGH